MGLLHHFLHLYYVGTSVLFCTVALPGYSPTNCAQGSFSSHLCHRLLSLIFLSFTILTGVMWSLGFFISFSLMMIVMLTIFSCTCWLFIYLLWKNVCSSPLPIFKILWVVWVYIYIYMVLTPLSDIPLASIFSHSIGCLSSCWFFLLCQTFLAWILLLCCLCFWYQI